MAYIILIYLVAGMIVPLTIARAAEKRGESNFILMLGFSGPGVFFIAGIALWPLWVVMDYIERKSLRDDKERTEASRIQRDADLQIRSDEEKRMIGMTGVTCSALRPHGIIEINERRVDAISESGMISPGHSIKIVGFRTGVAIVRPD
jgi:hypothetical protein